MNTLIVGAGALGGIISAHLLAAGASVSLATRNTTLAEEIKASGLRVSGIGGDLSIEAGEVAPLAELSVPGRFDLIVLATKAQDAIDVAPSLVRLLATGGTLLPIQNGGVPQMLASQLWDECVLGGLSNLTATMLRPGIYEQTNAGYLNGYVVDTARQVRVNTPVNIAIVETVYAITRGQSAPDPNHLGQILQAVVDRGEASVP